MIETSFAVGGRRFATHGAVVKSSSPLRFSRIKSYEFYAWIIRLQAVAAILGGERQRLSAFFAPKTLKSEVFCIFLKEVFKFLLTFMKFFDIIFSIFILRVGVLTALTGYGVIEKLPPKFYEYQILKGVSS